MLATQSSTVHAGDDSGGIVYAKRGSLWLRSDDGKGDSVELAALPAGKGPVTSIQVGRKLVNAVVEADGSWYWIPLKSKRKPRKLGCTGSAQLSPNGRCIICAGKPGQALLYILGPKLREMSLPFGDGPFGFAGSDRLAVVRKTGVWTTNPTGKKRRRLSPHTPSKGILIAPNGKRAVGGYDADSPGLFAFRLDGKAVRRKLLSEGTARAWSQDSKWLLIEQEKAACVVRGVGGQYKCWNKYRAGALSGDGSKIYLLKTEADRTNIYLAPTAGARAAGARIILKSTHQAAAWTPHRPKPAKAKEDSQPATKKPAAKSPGKRNKPAAKSKGKKPKKK